MLNVLSVCQKLGNSIERITTKRLKTNPQNKKGPAILGNRFPKNDLMSHTRPNDKAPDSIKNKSTPHLKHAAKISVIHQFNDGCAEYSLTIIPLAVIYT